MRPAAPVITESDLVDMDGIELSDDEAQVYEAKIRQADHEFDGNRRSTAATAANAG